ncbi:hypothetical protein M406DRAFT_323008 [Cryphonectria parasitica EP155]|uniref:Uncharacterized protein n=1 Tax=Cryphonectria parasitica (strain ATCC 38755 / EP155) TaxID=660469 RepID=A0A9P5CL97_CRYP1|nr:uncharacterized protein M406DRAFT_323008 [Cryphonectria parasitica EP155]KAF3763099.1 hypothetical protein M406DRAFT_323008 [Cryphonectria parasitica EP155]
MPICSYCKGRGLGSCKVSPGDSSRCIECVRLGRSKCDVMDLSPEELRNIATQHRKLEDEIEKRETELLRLRQQKRMWSEKMKRALRRGITRVEELDRVEAEEAEAERVRVAAEVQAVVAEESAVVVGDPSFESFDWNSVDVGNSVVDWSGFLESEISEVPGSRSGAERSS